MTTTADLAGWDVPQLRGAVVTLGVLVDRLAPWRGRLDQLGRELGAAASWSGPAGSAAAAALVELSTVASGVGGALAASLTDLTGLSAAADEAQELAAEALAVAAAGGVGLDGAGRAVGVPAPPAPAMAPDQLADVEAARSAAMLAEARAEEAGIAAARAAACARAALEPLTQFGAVAVPVPDRFADLVGRLLPVRTPQVPATAGPHDAAVWWAGLTAAGQLLAIDAQPGAVGALDGLPAWARDRANRANLAAALQHLPPGSVGHDTARAVQHTLTELVAAGAVAQLLQFDPAAGLVALTVGDLDTAAAVGVLVPGVETTVVDDLAEVVGDARDVAAAAAVAAPGLAVATVAWLGYRTPRWFTSVSEHASQRGGRDLDRALDGLAGSRGARGAGPAPRTTVLAHSYGTVVTGEAARAPGRLAADAVVLLGSPGTGTGRAEGLEAAEVYGAWSPADPIAWSGWYGAGPFDIGFGDVPLPTEPTQWHTQYYDRDRPTLAAIGEVVAGTREPR
ncbi:alpha/beta hydrolase [Modestobacter sp. VKM Ac-2979]|uniref:alpha/beta hydrolase n=1 Tax=unclassified Modestobacter TaxID=2643866 RepID=UPI0022AB8870|nr:MULTISPECIES: alpha/beta hydrolase [unclassified Modestobacter]MCZ2810674.1 alpha/beta hydrolase [Modestobacter sp. VKM Ac-2979]MCZ2842160.1 alpha/beta hydrolase [Modestobacter sp. VKM Ac-2980]